LALRWRDVDFEAKRIHINATIKTETGKGTYRKSLAKSRTIELPGFAVAALRRRQCRSRDPLVDALFPTRNGTWQQVNNVERRWRQIRTEAGLDWVKPEAFRRNVVRKP
jgi:integrase